MLAVQVSATLCWVACTPVPTSAIVAGEPVALLVTDTLPLELPAVVGSNTALNVNVCDAPSVTGVFAPVTEYPAPLAAICEI